MERFRDLSWKFWPLYYKFKNMRHGRGGWDDPWGYHEEYYYDWETGHGDWAWIIEDSEV